MSNIKENIQAHLIRIEESEVAPQVEILPARRGLGVIIVDEETGMIFVNRENNSKPSTGKDVNALSIPLETAKRDEDFVDNFYGALAEAVSDGPDQTVNHLQDQFTYAEEHAFHPDAVRTIIGTTAIECSVGIVVYSGARVPLIGHHHEEVTPHGWVEPEEFMVHPDRRPLAEAVVRFAVDSNLLSLNRQASDRKPIFGEGFSIGNYFAERELLEDN